MSSSYRSNQNLDATENVQDHDTTTSMHVQPKIIIISDELLNLVVEYPEETESETEANIQSGESSYENYVVNKQSSTLENADTVRSDNLMTQEGYNCRICNMFLSCYGFLKRHERQCLKTPALIKEEQQKVQLVIESENSSAASSDKPEAQEPFDGKIRIPLSPVNAINQLIRIVSSQDGEDYYKDNCVFKKPRFECQFCKVLLANLNSLKEHESRCMLTFPVVYSCGICQQKFVCSGLTKNHMSKSHNIDLK